MRALLFAGIVVGLSLAGCGGRDPVPTDGGTADTGPVIDAAPAIDAGHDAATLPIDGGRDAGHDAGADAGHDGGTDGGSDAGHDAAPIDVGTDADIDAGPRPDAWTAYSFDHPFVIDFSGLYDVDVVASSASTSFPPLVPVDGSGYVLLTESVASAAGDTGAGVRDDGFYAADANHPGVQFAFSDATAVSNALILNDPSMSRTSVAIDVAPGMFGTAQLFVTSTEGGSAPTIQLHYADGTTTSTSVSVPDWFESFRAAPPVFVVDSGLSRFSTAGDDFSGGASIVGIALVVDPTRVLDRITVSTSGTARLVLFGALAY
jgi:hypothetical protein